MKIAIYARVSTDKQSHDLQLAEVRDYCQRRGWTEVQEFVDVVSGATKSRQGLDSMMTLVRKGRIDVVVCFRLDRLARSLSHLAQLLAEFGLNKTALIIPGQGIDTSTSNPAAMLQLNILGAIAEFERGLIRERVVAGITAARARGVRFGRPSMGSRHLPAVRDLARQGLSTRTIAAKLKISKTMAAHLARQAKLEAPTVR